MRRTVLFAALLAAPLSATGCHDATAPAAGPPAAVEIAGGDGQSAPTSTRLPAALQVRVTDAAGRPVRGVHVAWAVDTLAGSLDTHESVTDGKGIAGVNWGVGSYAGAWTATATVTGLPPAVFHATATGPVALTLIQPLPGDTVDSLNVVVAVRGPAPLLPPVAWMGETKIVLHPDGQTSGGTRFTGSAPLSGTLDQDHPVRVVAGDSAGHLATLITDVHHDAPPEIQLDEPVVWLQNLVAGPTRVVATCHDDEGGCRAMELRVDGVRVASGGRDSLNATYSVAGYPRDSIRFVVVGTGAHGVEHAVSTVALAVEPDSAWARLLGVNGTIVDGDGERALYQTFPDLVLVRVLATGADQWIFQGRERFTGRVTAGGAVVQLEPGFNKGIRGVEGNDPTGMALAVNDGWAAWISEFSMLVRVNSLTRARATVPTAGHGFILSDDGSVTILQPAGGPTATLLRPDGTVGPLVPDTTLGAYWGMAEGGITLYERPSVGPTSFFLLDSAGEHALDVGVPGETVSTAYLRDGWVGMTTTDAAGVRRYWTRSPTGEVRRADGGIAGASLYEWGPAGKVMLSSGGRVYLLAPPYGSPRLLGPITRQYTWHRGRIYAVFSNALFRIDL